MAGRCGCGGTCPCCIQPTNSIGLAGAGDPGNCFSLEALYSSDAGNIARAGTDGGVFAEQCLLDPAGNPISSDYDGCKTIPSAVILDYNGNPIAPDDHGAIQLPTAGVPPPFGCGLATAEDGSLIVATTAGSWPLTDLAGDPLAGDYTDAGVIFCDPDGNLRTLPQGTAIRAASFDELLTPSLLNVTGTYTSPPSSLISVTNPSPTRSMLAFAFVDAFVELANPVAGGALVDIQASLNAGAFGSIGFNPTHYPEGSAAIRTGMHVTGIVATTIFPPDGLTIRCRATVTRSGVATDPVVLIEVSMTVTFLGVTV